MPPACIHLSVIPAKIALYLLWCNSENWVNHRWLIELNATSDTGLIQGLHPANERRRYKITPFLVGWVQT